ncbi:MAG: beta-lactamase family protein [Anaerolineales bacterium]|nr:beta-lactamase family protein [Anaerolineales bacterium]
MNLNSAALDAAIRAGQDRAPFSGVVMLSRGDDVLFQGAYGLALRGEEIPNQMDTRFQTASGCKAFTAAAILQLVASGALSLDTPLLDVLGEYVPQFAGYAGVVQIRHLITHTSGIADPFDEDLYPDYEALWRDRPVYRMRRPADFLPMFTADHLVFQPGERFAYNNGGFVLLGVVVEQVSGQPFVDYVTRNVFAPAGMGDSGYFFADQLPGRVARAYIQNEDGAWRTNAYAVPIIGGGDGGAYTTAGDMRRFWRALMHGELLAPEIAFHMMTRHVSTGQGFVANAYGLGVWIEQRGDAAHSVFVIGGDPGVAMRSEILGPPDAPWDSTLVLTMLGNTESALWPLWREVVGMLGVG